MNKKFGIGIPTVNRYDLLKPTLEEYYNDFPNTEILVIDNGHQDINHKGITLYIQTVNIGVAASWNLICNEFFLQRKYDYALLLNDDIGLGRKERELLQYTESINHLRQDIPHQKDDIGIIVSEKQWSVILIPKETFFKVGFFDDQFFPAYFEDNDYAYRMKLKGLKVHTTPYLNPAYYQQSMSMQKDQELANGFMKNRQRYIDKWGGLPGEEKFTQPFEYGNFVLKS